MGAYEDAYQELQAPQDATAAPSSPSPGSEYEQRYQQVQATKKTVAPVRVAAPARQPQPKTPTPQKAIPAPKALDYQQVLSAQIGPAAQKYWVKPSDVQDAIQHPERYMVAPLDSLPPALGGKGVTPDIAKYRGLVLKAAQEAMGTAQRTVDNQITAPNTVPTLAQRRAMTPAQRKQRVKISGKQTAAAGEGAQSQFATQNMDRGMAVTAGLAQGISQGIVDPQTFYARQYGPIEDQNALNLSRMAGTFMAMGPVFRGLGDLIPALGSLQQAKGVVGTLANAGILPAYMGATTGTGIVGSKVADVAGNLLNKDKGIPSLEGVTYVPPGEQIKQFVREIPKVAAVGLLLHTANPALAKVLTGESAAITRPIAGGVVGAGSDLILQGGYNPITFPISTAFGVMGGSAPARLPGEVRPPEPARETPLPEVRTVREVPPPVPEKSPTVPDMSPKPLPATWQGKYEAGLVTLDQVPKRAQVKPWYAAAVADEAAKAQQPIPIDSTAPSSPVDATLAPGQGNVPLTNDQLSAMSLEEARPHLEAMSKEELNQRLEDASRAKDWKLAQRLNDQDYVNRGQGRKPGYQPMLETANAPEETDAMTAGQGNVPPAAPAVVKPIQTEAAPSHDILVNPDELGVKPGVQYKKSEVTDEVNQVSNLLKGTRVYDVNQGGILTAWRDKLGKLWVVNGHHRLELAKRADTFVESTPTGQREVPRQVRVRVLDSTDGWTLEQARGQGALENIRDAKGTAIDAISVIRDLGITPEQFSAHGISITGNLARNMRDLMHLPDELLQRVQSGDVPEEVGAGVASVRGLQPAALNTAFDETIRGNITRYDQARRIAEMVKEEQDAGRLITSESGDLFGGGYTSARTTFAEQQKIEEAARKQLKGELADLLKPVGTTLREGEMIDATGRKQTAEAYGGKSTVLGARIDLVFKNDTAVKAEVARLATEVANGKLTVQKAAENLIPAIRDAQRTATKYGWGVVEPAAQGNIPASGTVGNEPTIPARPAEVNLFGEQAPAAPVAEGKPTVEENATAAKPSILADNTVFTGGEAALERAKAKLTRVSSGIDPTIIADLAEYGAAYAEAIIRKGVYTVRAWRDHMLEKGNELAVDLAPHLDAIWAATQEHLRQKQLDFPTSIRNATVDGERVMRGEKPMRAVIPKADQVTWDNAMNRMDADPELQQNLIAELDKRVRPITDEEGMILEHRRVTLNNNYNKVTDEIATAKEDGDSSALAAAQIRKDVINDQLLQLEKITGRGGVGTENARALRIRGLFMNEDYSRARLETVARAEKGDTLTPKEQAFVEKTAEDFKKANDALTKHNEKQAPLVEDTRLKQTVEQMKREPQRNARAGKPADTLAKIAKNVAEKGTPESLGNLIQKLARQHVAEGITERNALVDAVHADVKDVLPDWTRRQVMDAISGYGDFKPLTKDEVSIQLRDLKGQMQQIGKLEDMANGKAPLKTGVERRIPSELERQLIKEVNDAKAKGGYNVTDPAAQLRSALQSYKTRTEHRIADLQKRIADGDFATRKRVPLVLDTEGLRLQAEVERVKQQWWAAKRVWERANLPLWKKFLNRVVDIERAIKLTGLQTFGKLGAAAITRVGTTTTEEALGGVLGQLPLVRDVAKQAPRQGGFNARALIKGAQQALTVGIREAVETGLQKTTDLEAMQEAGKHFDREWSGTIGKLHGIPKAPIKRGEFALSVEKRMQWAADHGIDPNDPAVQAEITGLALNDGLGAIFMQDNASTDTFRQAVAILERTKGQAEIPNFMLAKLARFLFPIVKVPANKFAETAEGVYGAPVAVTRILFRAIRGELKALPGGTAEGDAIMRQLKKGSIGLALMTIGYFNADKLGGLDWRRKVKQGGVKFAQMRIGNVTIPAWALAAPVFELMQVGATVRHVVNDSIAKGHNPGAGFAAGVGEGFNGLLEQQPFVGGMARNAELLGTAGERTYAVGELLKGSLVPQLVQNVAGWTDPGAQRSPKTILQHIKVGIPGLRQQVPLKKAKGGGGSGIPGPPSRPTRPTRPQPPKRPY